MPLFSRLGSYDLGMAEEALWGHHAGHATEAFEHWGHEASVMPRDLLPAMHWRMQSRSSWKDRTGQRLEAERPGLIDSVQAAVEESGPVIAKDLDHMAPRERAKGPWWDASHVKSALEYLFITGRVAASRGPHFARTYDSTQRAWGLPPADEGDWGLSANVGQQLLFDRAISACGIGALKDLCDHYRLPYQARDGVAGAQAWAASAVERGLAQWVTVEGWLEPTLMASGASDPGRATGTALLSPFDPVCWFRPRLERMFGMEYRIEIYTPAAKRQHGYYCLPLLVGDQMAGRFDLKADRTSRVLDVRASWREERPSPSAPALSDAHIAAGAAKDIERMRAWLGLEDIHVSPQGNLASAVRTEISLIHR